MKNVVCLCVAVAAMGLFAGDAAMPTNLVVTTRLKDDYSAGTVIVLDENRHILYEKTYSQPKLWSAEAPNVYAETVTLDKGGWFSKDQTCDIVFGFRRVEFKEGAVYWNGRRLALKGIDLSAVPTEDALRIVEAFNANAVRFPSAPDDAAGVDRCDLTGFYVCCEADRVMRGEGVAKTLSNHPSLLRLPGPAETLKGTAFRKYGDLVTADGVFRPAAFAVQHAYRNVKVTDWDWTTKTARIRNDFRFTSLDGVRGMWKVDRRGVTVATGLIDLKGIAPDSAREIAVTAPDGDAILFAFGTQGASVPFAHDQFTRPYVAPPAPDMSGATEADGARFKPLDGAAGATLRARRLADGRLLVETTAAEVSFTIPADFTRVTWYGFGPWANTSDRREGAMLGIFGANITHEYDPDALNSADGARGARSLCRWIAFGNAAGEKIRVAALDAPIDFTAGPDTAGTIEVTLKATRFLVEGL